MWRFRDLSIRRKLIVLIGGTGAGAVLLVSVAVGVILWFYERNEVALDSLAQADLAARGSAAALLFDDAQAARENLRMFHLQPTVVAARLYDRKGLLFAEYRREGPSRPEWQLPDTIEALPEEGTHFLSTQAVVAVHPVMVRGERVGTVAVASNLSQAYAEVGAITHAVLVVMAASLALAAVLAARLQRVVSTPLLALAEIMERVSRERNYAVRAPVHGRDELAALARGFNDMLAQVQGRDQALERHRAELEGQVADRTRALAESNRQLTGELGERRRTEALVRGQNRALETLARGEPLARTLGVVARFLEAQVSGARCAILVVGESDGRMHHHYAARLPSPFVAALEARLAEGTEAAWPVGGDGAERIIACDIQDDPGWAPMSDLAKSHGLAACWCLPVASGAGRLLGRICLYHETRMRPEPAHVGLLDTAAALVAMAVEREQAAGKLTHMAHYDGLTGLPNRQLFTDRLTQALGRARRRRARVAVLFVDLDRFKPINDILGHAVGDRVLKDVSGRLRSGLREEDTLARIGGDEFTVILEDITGREDAIRVAGRLLAEVSPPIEIEGQEVVVGASVGIAMYPDDGTDAPELVKNADIAMYRAKQGGRGVFCFYTGEMAAEASRHMRMEAALRHSLERGEFHLYLQPQVETAGGRLVGAEALLRWSNPEFEDVGPDTFVPILEETGLIFPVGAWVLAEACRLACAWPQVDGEALRIAVNVSGRQLHHGDLPGLVARVLSETGLDAGRLELELTESVVMEHAGDTVARLEALDALGVSLAVDDFGTGYSSLTYLKAFPIRALKIDRSFVRDLTEDEGDLAIATAVISLAHSLDLHVVAEGVERADQLEVLRDLRCDLIQGYLFGRPEPAPDFARRLEVLGARVPSQPDR